MAAQSENAVLSCAVHGPDGTMTRCAHDTLSPEMDDETGTRGHRCASMCKRWFPCDPDCTLENCEWVWSDLARAKPISFTAREALALAMTFAAGASYEAGCVFWVHHAQLGQPMAAAMWSMFSAVVTVIGVESFLKSLPRKVAFVLGYGVGTALAVEWFS